MAAIQEGNDRSKANSGNSNSNSHSHSHSNSRFDGIAEELRFLSDLHRMRERGGSGPDGGKPSGGHHGKTNDGNHKNAGAGRTRTLKPRHAPDFDDGDFGEALGGETAAEKRDRHRRFRLFNAFARSVCRIGAIPRKEVFEAWAMALYVHECFLSTEGRGGNGNDNGNYNGSGDRGRPKVRRFADLACSHGLLSWALLLLSSPEEGGGGENGGENEVHDAAGNDKGSPPDPAPQPDDRPLTAVCIDIRMPRSSETAAGVFFEDHPRFRGGCHGTGNFSRWDYVEGNLEGIVADPSTLLVGIHACGRLSDTIIDLAVGAGAPLALVPCCHSKKILTDRQAEGFAALVAGAGRGAEHEKGRAHAPIPSYTLADFMDAHRKQRLVDAGYSVAEVRIPVEFTPKNRILLAVPPPAGAAPSPPPPRRRFPKKKRGWGIPLDIPVADTEPARAAVRAMAGREAADRRREEAHPPPSICIGVWLPREGEAGTPDAKAAPAFTAEALQAVIDRELFAEASAAGDTALAGGGAKKPRPLVTVENAEHKPYVHRTDGRVSRTLRLYYHDCRQNKARARERHRRLREVTIPLHFPGVTIRD